MVNVKISEYIKTVHSQHEKQDKEDFDKSQSTPPPPLTPQNTPLRERIFPRNFILEAWFDFT